MQAAIISRKIGYRCCWFCHQRHQNFW